MSVNGVNPFINENSGASLTLTPAIVTAGVPIMSSMQPISVQHIALGRLIEPSLLEWKDEKSYNLEL